MSSLQGSLGSAFSQEVTGRFIDSTHRRKAPSLIDRQLGRTAFRQGPAFAGMGTQNPGHVALLAYHPETIYKADCTLQGIRPSTETLAKRSLEPRSLEQLEQHYILEGKNALTALLQEQRDLPAILTEAVPQLRRWFGDRLLQLKATSDDDNVIARGSVVWPGSLQDAEAALAAFDQNWWLENCVRSHGYLVFDFELVDGV